ncbi:cystatin-like [Cetorhinus maximus]
MAGWKCLLAIFSVVLVSVSAFPSPNVKEDHEIAQEGDGRPLLLKVDTSDKEFQSVVEFVQLDFSKKTKYVYKIVQYLNANVQAFEGALYIFDIVLGKTNCLYEEHEPKDRNCQVIKAEGKLEFYLCHFITWKGSSPTSQRLLESKCQKLEL